MQIIDEGFLVLSRREGESVFVGEHIEVAVASIEGNKVRLAFRAPRALNIWRSELGERNENQDR